MTGADVKVLRERLHLSQEALARVLQISFVTVNRWERGRTQPINVVDLFVSALDHAAKRDPELVRHLPDWLERGEFYFWARIFALAHEHVTKGIKKK